MVAAPGPPPTAPAGRWRPGWRRTARAAPRHTASMPPPGTRRSPGRRRSRCTTGRSATAGSPGCGMGRRAAGADLRVRRHRRTPPARPGPPPPPPRSAQGDLQVAYVKDTWQDKGTASVSDNANSLRCRVHCCTCTGSTGGRVACGVCWPCSRAKAGTSSTCARSGDARPPAGLRSWPSRQACLHVRRPG